MNLEIGSHCTCRGHSTSCHVSPAGPLEPHLASPKRVLVGGPYGVLAPMPHPEGAGSPVVHLCFAI